MERTKRVFRILLKDSVYLLTACNGVGGECEKTVFHTGRKTGSISLPQKVRLQSDYAAGGCTTEHYRDNMAQMTSTFQSLSKEVLQLLRVFREGEYFEIVRILEAIQEREKEKLNLIVKWQIATQEQLVAQEGECYQSEEEVGCSLEDKQIQLKKRLAAVEGAIAALLVDFKFECEPILLRNT